ncbi:MAG: flagellar basal body rod protein FlgB [Thiotrichales bacterium]|nr:flagellar basal body rod protein FlgB [Thiotrichales bacterium]MBT3613916.1 flagellar basal body rod protein FlgB [Thiotrichales bacterium]MBT3752220.1 flagellar basal body rod protein FlgB [Thiotrichales bacterium]MBT3836856.1 flagellar basal body rod protein FlgB [Thiotrichales bacterium]MBT4151790.1 flagellar basal body rod protein FlgB [Thiotrichales bacterium]
MSNILDNYLGNHVQALQVRSKKTELLAANLANADTPGYKAKDIDFRAVLERASTDIGSMKKTHAKHFDFAGADSDLVQFRIPTQPSVDGNTVEAHIEKGEFLDNSMRYQATLQFLGGKFKALKSAIKGE